MAFIVAAIGGEFFDCHACVVLNALQVIVANQIRLLWTLRSKRNFKLGQGIPCVPWLVLAPVPLWPCQSRPLAPDTRRCCPQSLPLSCLWVSKASIMRLSTRRRSIAGQAFGQS